MLLAAAFGIPIGLAMGMVGGGGAVLAVPALVYAVGLDVHEATTVSLAVVAAAAVTGAVRQQRGIVCWDSAAWFAGGAAAGSALGTIGNRALGGPALLVVFAGVMLAAAAATWQRAGSAPAVTGGCPRPRARAVLPIGLGVGALTGLVGVGGGFVVVPALAIGLHFGLREAMATSMVVVAVVSLCGLGAHLAAGNAFDAGVALAMGAATVAGAIAGAALALRIPTHHLGRGFSLLVAAVALGVLGAALL